jgi:hypothetical protein
MNNMDEAKLASSAIEEPAFLDDDGPSTDVPSHVSTANIRELFGWQPGETLKEAVARGSQQAG